MSSSTFAFQSTHPRGVRRCRRCCCPRSRRNFNPRTHVGCDVPLSVPLNVPLIFQSTHPRGVRPRWPWTTLPLRYFNPRTHVGCDRRARPPSRWRCNFNPRTHVGCDMDGLQLSLLLGISIHAPTWGATVKPSNGWLLGHKDNEFANENIIIINSVNIT